MLIMVQNFQSIDTIAYEHKVHNDDKNSINYFHMRNQHRTCTQDGTCCVQYQHRLSLTETFCQQSMVSMSFVRLHNRFACELSADNRKRRIKNRNR